MTGMRLAHFSNNKKNNNQKYPEKKKGYLRIASFYLDLPNIKGKCQTIILRKILQRKMDFLKKCNVERKSEVTLRKR